MLPNEYEMKVMAYAGQCPECGRLWMSDIWFETVKGLGYFQIPASQKIEIKEYVCPCGRVLFSGRIPPSQKPGDTNER